MDKLDAIFARQKQLDAFLIEERGLGGVSEYEWIQKKVLATVAELGELLDEVRFKWWKNPAPVNEAKVKEELADVLHFFIGMCLNAGLDADELFKIYIGKNEENFKRQSGESEKKGYDLKEFRKKK